MLSTLRGGMNSFIVLLLMGLLVASFALFNVGGVFGGPGGQNLAVVGEQKVTASDFLRQFDNVVRREQLRNPDFTREAALSAGVDRQILGSLLQLAIIDAEAAKLGLTVSDAEIAREIAQIPAFQLNGQFDRGTYDFTLRTNGLTEKQLVEDLRADKTRALITDGLGGAVSVPQSMVNAFYRYQREQRVATVVTVPAPAPSAIPAADDAALQGFFEAHKTRYRLPELRSFSYALLDAAEIAAKISVTDAEVDEALAARRDEFETPERRTLQQVVFDDQAAAENFLKRLQAGGAFTTLATELAGYAAEDVALGTLGQSDLGQQLGAKAAEAVFALPADGVSGAIKSDFGWHVLKVTAITAAVQPDETQLRAELKETLGHERAVDQMAETANAVEDALAEGLNLEEIAKKFDLKLGAVAMVSGKGADASGAPVAELKGLDEVVKAAFTLQIGGSLELTPYGDDNEAVVNLTDIAPERDLDFAEAREKIVADWTLQEMRDRTMAAANALADAARGGGSLPALAKDKGYPIVEGLPIERSMALRGGSDAPVAQALFGLREGEIAVAPSAGQAAFSVVRNEKIIAADPAADPAFATGIRDQLALALASDIRAGYVQGLQREYPTQINEPLWKSVREQLGASTEGAP